MLLNINKAPGIILAVYLTFFHCRIDRFNSWFPDTGRSFRDSTFRDKAGSLRWLFPKSNINSFYPFQTQFGWMFENMFPLERPIKQAAEKLWGHPHSFFVQGITRGERNNPTTWYCPHHALQLMQGYEASPQILRAFFWSFSRKHLTCSCDHEIVEVELTTLYILMSNRRQCW